MHWKTLFIILAMAIFNNACQVDRISNPSQSMHDLYITDIDSCIAALESLRQTEDASMAQKQYRAARFAFKRMEPILSFTDIHNYRTLNMPNLLKVEEEDATDIKIKGAVGLQVMEELVFEEKPDWKEIHRQADFTANRLKLIRSNTDLTQLKKHHVLWIAQRQLARVALLGLSGFDSPVQAASLRESAVALESLGKHLDFWAYQFKDKKVQNEWNNVLSGAVSVLEEGSFDEFNRYDFIKNHIHPGLSSWNNIVKDWKVEFPFELVLQNDATSLFSSNTFNEAHFTDPKLMGLESEKAALGKQLFNDTKLSATNTMSCASCHKQELAFTDGMVKSPGQTRNSPTLKYASLQQKFFHDGRAGSLEGQIVSVVNSKSEFHSDLRNFLEAVKEDTGYVRFFEKLYPRGISDMSIRHAIASYIRSLAPFNSRFDQNINGKLDDLTKEEINGFNLFMGKAACATCHFPPTFNGTVPPEYAESEMELLGVPENPDTAGAVIDPDPGAWTLFHTPQRRYFFKTPTIRNIEHTAPYMHNGVYSSLEEVLDFYNRGGGAGIGIELEYQTLPPEPLGLSEEEQQAIIAFMKTLNDDEYNNTPENPMSMLQGQ